MSTPTQPGTDRTSVLSLEEWGFPFETELSLAPLARFWSEIVAHMGSIRGEIGRVVEQHLRSAPEMLRPIQDPDAFARHRELIEALFSVVFPPVFWNHEYGAVLEPFHLRSYYETPAFRRAFLNADQTLRARIGVDTDMVARIRLLLAYRLILQRVHGLDLHVEAPLIFTTSDPDTGLDRHFKMHFDWRFVDVEPVGPVAPFSDEARQLLPSLAMDPEALGVLLPFHSYRFSGFTVLTGIEVTDQEVLSSLKRDLIDKESIVSNARFGGLEDKLRTLFRRPKLQLSLSAIEGDRVLMLNSGARLASACIFADSVHHRLSDFGGSLYERASLLGQPIIVEDLAAYPERSWVEDAKLEHGTRSIIAAPLHYQDALIGTLSLISPEPGDFTAAHLPKLGEVLPLFSMAVKRSTDELNTRIQAFIKEKCTAIHPVVEWRFRKAVLDGLERQDPTVTPGEMGEIVFENVYPLYALSDVRGSSTQRAWAIQADLLAQLALARDVLAEAYARRPLPILDHLARRIDAQTAEVEVTLRAGDEATLLAFLRKDIEPLFDHLQSYGAKVRDRIEAYRGALDPRLGMVYRRRQAFEASLTRLNEAISSYIDLEEQAAQAMFPHYFEKQKTDGVDFSLYVGATLLEDGGFDPLYLKNLRLWQLMVACGIAMRAERLKDQLPIPLETTSLVLVQNAPLSIRFRFDEKRFDVDGAYNVRYEIIKKRIDKAIIRNSQERLTQPGKIAIVYSHSAEAAEYRHYIEYLQRLGHLTREVEELELAELQGADGLRALRVTVDLTHPEHDTPGSAAAALSSSPTEAAG